MDISSFLLLSTLVMASPGTAGDSEVLRAYAKQSGLEAYAKRLEREQLSPEVRWYAGNAVLVSKALIDRRLTVQWTFP